MTANSIRFVNPPSAPELYSDYVIATYEEGNVSLRFYRRRPVLAGRYEIADDGRIQGLNEDYPHFEGVLQATLTLPLQAAYHLYGSLDYIGIKPLVEKSKERFAAEGLDKNEN